MKTLGLSFSLLFSAIVTSCSTEEKTIDARQRYIGTYAIVSKQSVTVISPDTSYTESKIITSKLMVSKDDNIAKIKLKINGYGYPALLATLDNNTFELDLHSVRYKLPSGTRAVVLPEGNGFFVGNRITFNVTIDAISDGLSLRDTSTMTGKKE